MIETYYRSVKINSIYRAYLNKRQTIKDAYGFQWYLSHVHFQVIDGELLIVIS
jgi:hypothetical protein